MRGDHFGSAIVVHRNRRWSRHAWSEVDESEPVFEDAQGSSVQMGVPAGTPRDLNGNYAVGWQVRLDFRRVEAGPFELDGWIARIFEGGDISAKRLNIDPG